MTEIDRGRLAELTHARGLPFLFASTVMVFTDDARGPFTADSIPDAKTGYGGEKREAELLARAANPLTRIARLGWQIGEPDGSNNMVTQRLQPASDRAWPVPRVRRRRAPR